MAFLLLDNSHAENEEKHADHNGQYPVNEMSKENCVGQIGNNPPVDERPGGRTVGPRADVRPDHE